MHTALLAPSEPLGQRLAVLGVCLALGAYLILVGRNNIRTREAEETGKRAALLSALGKPTSMSGKKAVAMGWLRIVLGIGAILFGFVFLAFGAFLRN
ncbi:MAG: hypothetical protein IPK67_11040 [Planctomycetes bacterium]|jgi:hypothetical protein|nr:hypothetical protein [Planctomycetota bacterium]